MAMHTQYSAGLGDIDGLFGLDVPFVLEWIRIHFRDVPGDASTTGADVTLTLDSARGENYDILLWTFENRGVNGDRNFRIPSDETRGATFSAADRLRLQWTSPDPTKIHWSIQMGLNDATD
jgi:hypothetical protein